MELFLHFVFDLSDSMIQISRGLDVSRNVMQTFDQPGLICKARNMSRTKLINKLLQHPHHVLQLMGASDEATGYLDLSTAIQES